MEELPLALSLRSVTVGSLTNHFGCYAYLWKQCEENSDVCDVVIKFDGGGQFKVHWCVLMQCPYFKALYDSGMEERKTAILELSIVPPDVAKLALKFLYLRCIEAEPGQLADLLKVADYIQIETLIEACSKRLMRLGVTASNCLEMYSLGELYHSKKLFEVGESVLVSEFEKVAIDDNILKISTDFLVNLITRPALRRIRTKTFFDLLLRWTEHSSDRTDSFPRIFSCLDLKDIPLEILQDEIVGNHHVRHHDVCKQLVEDHLRLIGSGILDPTNPGKDVILVTGRSVLDHNFGRVMCYAYVIDDQHWTQFASIPRGLQGKVTVVGKKAYFCAINHEGEQKYVAPHPDDNKRMKVFQLLPANVRKDWAHIKTESASKTFEVLCNTSSGNGSLLTVGKFKNWEVRLKVIPAEYLRWCAERKKNPALGLPQKMAVSVGLVKLNRDDESYKVSASIVCYGAMVFIYVRQDLNKERKKSQGFFFNLETNGLSKFTGGLGIWGHVLYLEGKMAYLESVGDKFSFACDMTEMMWYQIPRGLPYLPRTPVIKEYSIVTHEKDIYALCLSGRKSSSENTLYKLNRADFVWESLSVFPVQPGLKQMSCTLMKVNKMKLRCPVECQDCQRKLQCSAKKRRLNNGQPEPSDPHDLDNVDEP